MKSFTELTLQTNMEGAVAQYMDDQISEEDLIDIYGTTPLVYGLISMNLDLNHDVCYELIFAELIDKKPVSQQQFDEIIEKLFADVK